MLVVIILGLAMIGIGTSLFFNAFNKTAELKANVDTQTQARINALLDDGSIVVIPQKNIEGSRGKLTQFSLGITNIYPEEKDFIVKVTYGGSTAYPDNTFPSCSGPKCDPFNPFNFAYSGSFARSCATNNLPEECGDSWVEFLPDGETFSLNANERKFSPIGIHIPKTSDVISGQYIFNVDICLGDSCESNTGCTSVPGSCYIVPNDRYDSRHQVIVTI